MDPPLGKIDLKAVQKVTYSDVYEDKFGFEVVLPDRTYYCVCHRLFICLGFTIYSLPLTRPDSTSGCSRSRQPSSVHVLFVRKYRLTSYIAAFVRIK